MRYYIYLDKILLQILFSTIENTNFDIEVVEYSVRKNYGRSQEISASPGIESICNFESMSDQNKEELKKRENHKEGNLKKEQLGVSFEQSQNYSLQTERRYINIEDISNMKNNTFYHKLINLMNQEIEKENSRIIKLTGMIEYLSSHRMESTTDGFFKIEENIIWFEKEKLKGNIELLSYMNCNVSVIGYRMNCNQEDTAIKIIKAIAIFLE